MKRRFTIPVVATGLLLVFGLTNCKKEQGFAPQDATQTQLAHPSSFTSITASDVDRIDAILKDLDASSYSLSFDKANSAAGITRTMYGAESSYTMIDPGDAICPDLFRKVNKYIPVPKWPQFVRPTCPTMIPWEKISQSITEVLYKADPGQFKGLQGIKTYSGEFLLGNQVFQRQYASYKVDALDKALSGLDPAKFVLLSDPRGPNGILTRETYGYADLNQFVFKPYKKSLKDIIVFPKVIGCFDPEILKVIQQRIQEISPSLTKQLGVTPLAGAQNVAVLNLR